MWRCWKGVNYLANNDLAYGIKSGASEQLHSHAVNMGAMKETGERLCPCVADPQAECSYYRDETDGDGEEEGNDDEESTILSDGIAEEPNEILDLPVAKRLKFN